MIFRRLTQTKFKDSAELQSAYFKTAPQITSFQLVPSWRAARASLSRVSRCPAPMSEALRTKIKSGRSPWSR